MWAKKQNPFIKTCVIPNGVNLNHFDESTKSIKTDLPRPLILNVAAFVGWKRQALLIRAVSKLEKGSLLLVGDGAEKEKLAALCEELLPDRYEIRSFPYSQMPTIYPAADLFSFPTVPWESFGIVMVEAMASGLAVVATDDPIRKEIVGRAGILVDPTDTDAYADALQKALVKNWGDLPRKQAEKFGWDKIAAEYEKMFLEIVK